MKKPLLLAAAILGSCLLSLLFPWSSPGVRLANANIDDLSVGTPYAEMPVQDFEALGVSDGWLLAGQRLLRTRDSGISWTEITPDLNSESSISAVDFINPEEGWLVGTATNTTSEQIYTLSRTLDGGGTWEISKLDLFKPGDPDSTSQAVYLDFIDSNSGWLVVKAISSSNFSNGSLFRTSDGGKSWERLEIPIGEDVVFTAPMKGWVAGGAAGNELYSTMDGGETWQAVNLPGSSLLPPTTMVHYQTPSFSSAVKIRGYSTGILPVITNLEGRSEVLVYLSQDDGITWTMSSRINPDRTVSTDINLPIAVLDAQTWMLVNPSDGQVWLVAGDSGELLQGTRLDFLRGAQKITGSAPGMVWSSYWRGSCDSDGCNRQSGLLRLDEPAGVTDSIYLSESYQPFQSQLEEPFPGSPSTQSATADLSKTLTLMGQGFDKCDMATVEQHQDWHQNGPYKTSNLYIGGIARACKTQAAMTKSNLLELNNMGWTFIPTWVGPQAPCSSYTYKIPTNTSQAYQQGIDEANAAIDAAFSLGLTEENKSGTVIYYDLEPFDVANTACLNSVRSFVNGWSSQMKTKNNLPGVYSGGKELNEFDDLANPPKVIWPANWYCPTYPDCSVYEYREDAHVWNVSGLPNTLWNNHERIRQYAGGHNETWGTTTLKIDSNVIDGVVAAISKYQLNIVLSGGGAGSVTSTPAGIECGSTCTAVFEPDSLITLQHSTAPGSFFAGWEGPCTVIGDKCEVTMNQTYQVTAKFEPYYYFYLPYTRDK